MDHTICTCNQLNIGRKKNTPYQLCPLCEYYHNETRIRINMIGKLKWGPPRRDYLVCRNKEYLLAELKRTHADKIMSD